jgi:hypothetical protein
VRRRQPPDRTRLQRTAYRVVFLLLVIALASGLGAAAPASSPEDSAAADLWLVETSVPLIEVQRERLRGGPLQPRWADGLAALPG